MGYRERVKTRNFPFTADGAVEAEDADCVGRVGGGIAGGVGYFKTYLMAESIKDHVWVSDERTSKTNLIVGDLVFPTD